MWTQEEYRKAVKSYRNGFGFGVLLGFIVWIVIGKTLWSFPIMFGLFFGAVAFQLRIAKEQKK